MSLPEEPPALAMMSIGAYISLARLLGQRTAEMHLALASAQGMRDFDSEPFTQLYQTSLYQSMRGLAMRNLGLLERQMKSLPDEVKELAQAVLDMRRSILDMFQEVRREKITASRIRCHGDYHLGQVLYTGRDFVIIDFEGEPARPLSERRLKRCPLRDVAGMIRSLHYAAHSAAQHRVPLLSRPEDDIPVLEQWAEFWYTWVSASFLTYYLNTIGPAHLLPKDPEQTRTLLDAYLLEKAIYEVGYEINNRPTWVKVPLQGIIRLLET
jgi:maltose alpha-D-glucosyltransferase/alpha-amylase